MKINKLRNQKGLTLSQSKGFTIIEVLIVLAIAGLIMLIVFLAVPALQRNQRNTGRRNDASRIATAGDNRVTNTNGLFPVTAAAADATQIIADAGTLGQFALNATGTYTATCANAIATGVLNVCNGPVTATAVAGTDGMKLGIGVQCNGNNVTVAGSARQMALLYTLEGQGTARTIACLNL